MKTSEQKCGNCAWMRKDKQQADRMRCHAGLPIPATSAALGWTQRAQAVWPEVQDDSWCAHWHDEGAK